MKPTWMSYRSDERMVMVDARFERGHPPELDHSYVVTAPMQSAGNHGYGDEAEVARFSAIEEMLDAEAGELGLVLAGRRRGFGTWEVFWYGPPGADRKFFRALKDHPEADLAMQLDVDWQLYRDKLLPRGKDLHRARNGLVVYQLVEAGDALDLPRLIEFFVKFHRDIDRDRFLRDVTSIGLDAEAYQDGDRPGVRAYFTAAVDVELITDITWELHERARDANGTFDGWGCAPVLGT